MSYEVVDCSANAEKDVQYTSDPDELLGECTGECEICPGQDQSDGENEHE